MALEILGKHHPVSSIQTLGLPFPQHQPHPPSWLNHFLEHTIQQDMVVNLALNLHDWGTLPQHKVRSRHGILGRLEDGREAITTLAHVLLLICCLTWSAQSSIWACKCFPFPRILLQLLQFLIQMYVFSCLRKGPGSSRSSTLASWEAVKVKVPVSFPGVSAHAYGFQAAPDSPHYLSIFPPNCLPSGPQAPTSDMIQQIYRLLNQFPQLLRTKFLY